MSIKQINKNNMKENLATINEIIEDAKNGKMFILVDDENRENEGDLVIPAQFCDSDSINFMAKFGRGLICLALNEDRVQDLALPLMAMDNRSRNKTAFTISIEAKEGITTGISAHDRAKTVRDAIDINKTKDDIVSPGHIFPLKAQKGGVLVRAGHTEAAVDISRLAGLNESGVICEIMKDNGEMARLPDLIEFAKEHNLKVATIADLIEYRRKNEQLVEAVFSQEIHSDNGLNFNLIAYKSKVDNIEHIALVKGKIDSEKPVLVRMHHLNIFSDCLGFDQNYGSKILEKSIKRISQEDSGAIVLIRQTNERVEDLLNRQINKSNILRNYGVGAQILLDLGIKNIRLLTKSKKSVIGIDGYGLKISEYVDI